MNGEFPDEIFASQSKSENEKPYYMPREMKYVVIMDGSCECAIIFNHILGHKQIVGANTCVGAGMVKLSPDAETNRTVASCYGESVTLEIKSRLKEDEELIERTLNERY